VSENLVSKVISFDVILTTRWLIGSNERSGICMAYTSRITQICK